MAQDNKAELDGTEKLVVAEELASSGEPLLDQETQRKQQQRDEEEQLAEENEEMAIDNFPVKSKLLFKLLNVCVRL